MKWRLREANVVEKKIKVVLTGLDYFEQQRFENIKNNHKWRIDHEKRYLITSSR